MSSSSSLNRVLRILLLAIGIGMAAPVSDLNWGRINPSYPGADGFLGKGVYFHGKLVIYGTFQVVGTRAISHIAAWNGSDWEVLGSVGKNTDIKAMVLNPATGNLLFGGNIQIDSGSALTSIAEWNGISWKAVAPGLNMTLQKLTVDSKGGIYAFGYDSTNALLLKYWNGSSWAKIGSMDMGLYCMIVDSKDHLVISGWYKTVNGDSLVSPAKWVNGQWSALGSGINGQVNDMVLDRYGDLYLTGKILVGSTFGSVAKWNGTTGTIVVSKMFQQANAVCVDSLDHVYVGGIYESGTYDSLNVAYWNGTTLEAAAKYQSISNISDIVCKGGPLVGLGSAYSSKTGFSALSIAVAQEGIWKGFTVGLDNSVYAMLKEKNGNLVVGGEMRGIGDLALNHIASWDGKDFHPLGTGLNSYVRSIALDSSGNLIAGGGFDSAGSVKVSNIASWNGSKWSTLGNGLNSVVSLISVGPKGMIYAGGTFRTSGSDSMPGFAQWDGVKWSRVPGWVYADSIGNVTAMRFSPQGVLYVGTSKGLVAYQNGASWVTLLKAKYQNATEQLAFNSKGVLFQATSNYIMSWNNTKQKFDTLFTVGGGGTNVGVGGAASMLFDSQDRLYVAGQFTQANADFTNYKYIPAISIVRWSDGVLEALGSGLQGKHLSTETNGSVVSMIFLENNQIAVGGNFLRAGGRAAPFAAMFYIDGTLAPTDTPIPGLATLWNGSITPKVGAPARLRMVGSTVTVDFGADRAARTVNGRIATRLDH